MGEGTLPEGFSLPVRAIWSPTPGQIRLLRPNGEVERDVRLPYPAGGYFSSLSEDGSLAILRSAGAVVRGSGRFSTRVVDLKEERVLFEGETTGDEAFFPSPGGEMVLHRHSGRASALRRPDWSLIKSMDMIVTKWDFSKEYLATLEVDLERKDTERTHLLGGSNKGPLYLRAYDFDGDVVLDEFLDEISTAIQIDTNDNGTIAALYRTHDIHWTPPRTFGHSVFILILADIKKRKIERRWFTVERSTDDVGMARSPNGRYLALSVFLDRDVDLYDVDTILATPDTLCRPLRSSAMPDSFKFLGVSGRGIVLAEALCTEGDHRFQRVMVSDLDGTWSTLPAPDLDLNHRIQCRFFGPEDDLLLRHGQLFKCFRIRRE